MAGDGKITRQQEKTISALLLKNTVQEAAQAAGVGERTLWRWLQRDDFQRSYKQARREAVSQAVAQLQRVSGDAVEALSDVMNDREAPASARVSAARTVLEMAIKAVEIEELEGRISELEKINTGGIRNVEE